jgi:tetratricopeptide (TPR) repeat protein
MFMRMLLASSIFFGLTYRTWADDPATKPAETPATPVATSPAQEQAPATSESSTKPDESPATEAPKVDDAKRKASEAKFDEALQQWTDLRDKLEKLQTEYKSTKPADRKPLVEKFDAIDKQGKSVEQQLMKTAVAAYRDSAGEVTKAGDVLQSLSFHYFNQDRYERSLAAARPVLDIKPMNDRLLNIAGMSAFHTNHYDLAEKYMKKAEEAGVLDRHGKQLLASVPTTKELWDKEKAIREKEDQGARDHRVVRERGAANSGQLHQPG